MVEWVFANLVAPIGAPVLGALLVAMFLFKKSSKKGHPLVAFKDGQLAWATLGMCLNGLYELLNPAAGVEIPRSFSVTMGIILVVLLMVSIGMAVLGAAMPVPWWKSPSTPTALWKRMAQWLLHYVVFVSSLVLVAATIYVYWETHLTTQGLAHTI